MFLHSYKKGGLLLLAGLAITYLGTGCSSFESTQVSDMVPPALGATGAAIGMYAGKDKDIGTQMAYSGAGLAGGYLAGLFFNNNFKEEKMKEFRSGYDLGRSNATKELYWCTQQLHEAKNSNSKVVYYQIPHIYHADGVNRVPSTAVIPVVTSK